MTTTRLLKHIEELHNLLDRYDALARRIVEDGACDFEGVPNLSIQYDAEELVQLYKQVEPMSSFYTE